ncbi:hypothetical protein F383_25117 [Gossypium arboreum]|uniref:Uncharacterized protein n=1 Tax=Gossypium arboreum TaxID=29729 RepID=A0A0B0P2U5_GOSAR|nr:hypothetical protein F383_25117 [Gossypium arboreum]
MDQIEKFTGYSHASVLRGCRPRLSLFTQPDH